MHVQVRGELHRRAQPLVREARPRPGRARDSGERRPTIRALVTPDGSVRQVAGAIAFPNGMVATPDNSTLIVAESLAGRLTAFDVAADDGLSNRRVWADLAGGFPDGSCLDADGTIWYADVPNKRCVRVRQGGQVLETIELDRSPFACMLGGPDGHTLYILAAEWRGIESWTRRSLQSTLSAGAGD